MATTADFRNGCCLELHGKCYILRSFQHVKPGKGAAFVRTKLKGMPSGKVVEHTFAAGVSVTTARIERKSSQYLYCDEKGVHFMECETYEPIVIPKRLVSRIELLKAGEVVDLLVHQERNKVLSCELRPSVLLKVIAADGGTKGNTAKKAMKPATLEGGAVVQVPLFIQVGDLVKINTERAVYLARG